MTDVKAYLMPVPVHTLASTEDYLSILDGHPQVSAPGERFAYNNGGFVVLALIAERASGEPFHRLVDERVCEPAGLRDTGYLRSDELPGMRPSAPFGPIGHARTSSTSRCAGQATAGSTRRPPISRGSGKPSSRARSCRSMPSPRWCAHGAIGRRRTAVRARVPPAPDDRCRMARGLRRGGLVHEYARARSPDHGHGDLEHGRGRVAVRRAVRPRARDLGAEHSPDHGDGRPHPLRGPGTFANPWHTAALRSLSPPNRRSPSLDSKRPGVRGGTPGPSCLNRFALRRRAPPGCRSGSGSPRTHRAEPQRRSVG